MKHRDIYIHSSNLISLLMESMDDAEIADALGCETETTNDDDGPIVSVVDPDCWYRVSWPDHVVVARYNSDASYHPVDTVEVAAIVESYNSIHADSAKRANDLA